MSDDPKEPLNFVTDEARAAWEAEARRTAAELAAAARDQDSDEAFVLRSLDANLREFAAEWVWDDRTEP